MFAWQTSRETSEKNLTALRIAMCTKNRLRRMKYAIIGCIQEKKQLSKLYAD